MSDNIIKMSVKGRYSHSMTLSEKALFDAFDIFYLDDPALFESSLREKIMCFASLTPNDIHQHSDDQFRHLIDELSFQIKQMNSSQWEAFTNAFWVFYDKNVYGFASAKDSVLATFTHAVANYMQSLDEGNKEYTNQQLIDLLSKTNCIIDRLDIYWAKQHLSPYIEQDVIQIFRLEGVMEEMVLDEVAEEIGEEIVFKVLLS